MNWVDVAGPPGIGKSTLCYPVWKDKSVTDDGLLPPIEWHDFLNEIWRLLALLEPHKQVFVPELDGYLDLFTPAHRMNLRTIKKMSAVARMEKDERSPFVQTGFVQRGLGFGWRLQLLGGNLDELQHYWRLMPISQSIVFLEASDEELARRNHARRDVPETAHEDRTYQIGYMRPAIEAAKRELSKRCIVNEIDVETKSIDKAREKLKFYCQPKSPECPVLSGDTLLSAPVWWQ